ncbi:MAG: hypothetical protein HY698_14510 [Deltaproteobacteria bacterium]|nr:hypothetical protein [Deltaproteobacteria bacterium]
MWTRKYEVETGLGAESNLVGLPERLPKVPLAADDDAIRVERRMYS